VFGSVQLRDSASVREEPELRFDGGELGRDRCWLARDRMAVAEWGKPAIGTARRSIVPFVWKDRT
jgi:hypothetical protein